MARIRHLAICTNRQEELAEFYCTTFGLTEQFRHTSAESGKIAIYLSDGAINLAVIPANAKPERLDHLGFEVEDIDAVAGAALANGATAGPKAVPQDGRQNEAFIADPVGQRIDLSSAGWKIGGGGKARIRHVAIASADPPKLAAFYAATFGLHEVFRRDWERGAVYLSDGHVNLALLPSEGAELKEGRAGIDHLGFHVEDLAATIDTAYANGATPNDYELPRDGRFAETFVFDPIGQRVDLSQTGWKTVA